MGGSEKKVNNEQNYELKLYPQAWGRIATVSMRWQDPDTREVMELSKDFDTYQMSQSFRRADPYFQLKIAVSMRFMNKPNE